MGGESYRGKSVVVTGCSSGIGQATARALVELGADVHGFDRAPCEDKLASFATFDLAEPGSITEAVAAVGGEVDALFNCAGAVPMLASSEILKVNYLGTRLFTELLVDRMPAGAAVVSVSSDAGFWWRKQLPLLLEFLDVEGFEAGLAWYEEHAGVVGHAYAFGKAALNAWTMKQSAALIHRGIRINTVSPGAVQTPMLEAIEAAYSSGSIDATTHPIGRRSAPEEQAGPLLFLNSPSASYINGIDLVVDGGYWASLSLEAKLWG